MTTTISPLVDALVRRPARRHADSPALETGSVRISYRDLERLSDALARQLVALGVGPGDRVMLMLSASAEYVISFLAVTTAGAIAVPVPPTVGPDRLRYLIDITEPRACLVEAPMSIERCPWHVVTIEPPGIRLDATQSVRTATLPSVRPDAPAAILFSSGSTGRPKGVVLRHRHLIATARNLSSVFGIDAHHRDLIVAPMFHSDGWQRVAATLFGGGCVVISPQSATTVLESLSALRITGCFLPTPVLRLLLRSSPDAMLAMMSPMRSLELGSTPISAQELRRLCDSLPEARVFFHYGLTECSRASILKVREHSRKLATVGTAAPGVEIRIVDSQGDTVAAGETGQILLRGPQQSDGYWNRPDLNREKFANGWLLTGDYGSLDEDGFLTLAGRRDDMITSAGYHFFPAEVETELGPVPGVVDYIVAGMSSAAGLVDQWLWAFVVPADPQTWRPNEFLTLARKRLPSHMMPRQVIPVPALPLTPSGKPDRARTVRLYAETGGGR
jgi:fatty-acyl-CoA synthase